VPVEFHEENFRMKEINKDILRDVFAELEFKTLGKRVLGDEFAITVSNKDFIKKEQPVGVQTDLFGNIVESAAPAIPVEQASSNGNDRRINIC
jgi:DNA polymerase-1